MRVVLELQPDMGDGPEDLEEQLRILGDVARAVGLDLEVRAYYFRPASGPFAKPVGIEVEFPDEDAVLLVNVVAFAMEEGLNFLVAVPADEPEPVE